MTTDDELCEALENGEVCGPNVCKAIKPGICPCATAAARIRELNTRLQAAEKMAEALRAFARCPTHGKHGGPFVIANAVFEDMTKGSSAPREAYWHKDDFERARAALTAWEAE